MATLRLTPHVAGTRSTDLDRTNNRCTLVTGDEEIAQRIRCTLQSQFGESPYHRNGGTPYTTFRDQNDMAIRSMIAAVVRNVTGVVSVIECSAVSENDDSGRRIVTVSGVVGTVNSGVIPFSTAVV